MRVINYLRIAVLAACFSLIFSGCGGSKKSSAVSVTDANQMPRQIGVPAEVELIFPCSGVDSDLDFVRVNGQGNSKDRTMAKDSAIQSALAELATKLGGVASSENSRVGVSTNADGEEFHDKVVAISKVVARNVGVAGYRTSCEKYTMNTMDGSYNCYVTLDFGKQKLVQSMFDAMSGDKLMRADYDFDRYMKAFEADLKEYEAKNRR